MPAPDLILTNANVYTVDAGRSRAEAVAVRGGRIVAVGAAGEVEPLAGPRTQVLDLARRLVLPGFIDAHMHAADAVHTLLGVPLEGLGTVDACLDAVARFARAHPDQPWVHGFGWSADLTPPERLRASELDAVVADRPVALFDDGYHRAWVNHAALELAAIDAATPDPDNGIIERLPDGAPSGLLEEGPAFLLDGHLQFSATDMLTSLRHFGSHVAAPLGLTTVQDSGMKIGGPEPQAWAAFIDDESQGFRGALSWWIREDRPLDDQLAAAVAGRKRLASPVAQARTAKFFVDGVIEGHSALLSEPYLDRPASRGTSIWRPDALCAAATAAAGAGLQLHFHAIGDAAVSLALDSIEAAAQAAGRAAVQRPLIAHLQLAGSAHARRMATTGAIAVMQPAWLDGTAAMVDWYEPLVGRPRASHQYPMKTFWDHGVRVASSSDFPVPPAPDPLVGIQKGVLRTVHPEVEPSDAMWPRERVTVEQMIESYTINGAYANFLEDETGSIEVGKAADLVVLSEDITRCQPQDIAHAEVELTLFGGRATHASGPFAGLTTD